MNTHFKKLDAVSFPAFQGAMVNMMPIIVGDKASLPEHLQGYQALIDKSSLKKGSLAYLTVRESVTDGKQSQGRGGIHVEAPKMNCWGGGNWGGSFIDKGIYMASNDGACNLWDERIEDRDHFGGCTPVTSSQRMQANRMYWMTDRTPHESLPSEAGFKRQFFRLVSDEISVWYSQHNTVNPKGILPSCEIVHHNKFH